MGFRKYINILIGILLFSGCAIHAPMSEMGMFNPKTKGDNLNYAKRGYGVSSQFQYFDVHELEKYIGQNYENSYLDGSVNEETVNAPTVGLSLIRFVDSSDSFAFSASFLPVVGIDFTYKFKNKYYLTLGHTVLGGQQIILQRKLIQTSNLGCGVGVYYDHLYQPLNEDCADCTGYDLTPDDKFYLNTIGLRSIILGMTGDKKRLFVKANIKLGYALKFKEPMLGMGVSVGIY